MKKVTFFLVLGMLLISTGSFTWADEIDVNTQTEIMRALYEGGYYATDDYDDDASIRDQHAIENFETAWDMDVDGELDQIVVDKLLQIGLLEVENLKMDMYSFSHTLYKLGDRNSDVIVLQRALLIGGHLTDDNQVTGIYDRATEDAIKSFQSRNGLESDGIVGPMTLEKMQTLDLTEVVENMPVSRGTSRIQTGEYLNWWTDVKEKIIDRGTVLHIRDIYTGLEYDVMMTYGANHADVEAMTLEDAEIMKQAAGGDFSWERRPVLVFVDDRVIAASMAAMPHAGRDDKPAEAWISNRSLNYGTGYNLDKIKNNGMDGVCDLHFAGSKRHLDNQQDSKHQAAIRIAAGL